MKNFGLTALVLLTLTAVSCGKKDEKKSSSKDTNALGTDACNNNNVIKYVEKEGTVDWTTGIVSVGGKEYKPTDLSQNARNQLDQAYSSKDAGVNYRSNGQKNAQGLISYVYEVRMKVAMVTGVANMVQTNPYNMYNPYNPGTATAGVQAGAVAGTACQLDIQSAKFHN